MSQVIQLQVGSCGNKIGLKYWDILYNEHHLDSEGKSKPVQQSKVRNDRIHACFKQTPQGRYIPRTLLMDTDTTAVDRIMSSDWGARIPYENIIYSSESSRGIFQNGARIAKDELKQDFIQAFRRQAQQCDLLAAVNIVYAMNGGAAGLADFALRHLADEYKGAEVYSHLVSSSLAATPHANYNSLLAVDGASNFSHSIHYYSTDAIFDSLNKTQANKLIKLVNKTGTYYYDDLNNVIATAMADLTSCMRLSYSTSTSLRKIYTNLVPFPCLKHFGMSLTDLNTKACNQFKQFFESAMLSKGVNLSGVNPRHGRTVAAATITRSASVNHYDLEQASFNIQNRSSSYFVEWLPNNLVNYHCRVPRSNKNPFTILSIQNSTANKHIFAGIVQAIEPQLRRKVALNSTNEGEHYKGLELKHALDNLKDIRSMHDTYENATAEQEEEEWGG